MHMLPFPGYIDNNTSRRGFVHVLNSLPPLFARQYTNILQQTGQVCGAGLLESMHEGFLAACRLVLWGSRARARSETR